MNKNELYRLLDEVPESELPTVRAFLGFVIYQSQKNLENDFLDSKPYDDEEYSEDVLGSLDEALEECRRGETVSHAEMKRRYNIA